MTTFTETAMADRFKQAQAEPAPKTIADASSFLLNEIESWDAWKNNHIDAKASTAIMLEYIHRWATGGYNDKDLVEMLRIRLNNIAIDLTKKATEGQS